MSGQDAFDERIKTAVSQAIETRSGRSCRILSAAALHGGDISAAFRLTDAGGGSYFAKLEDSRRRDLLAAELDGLQALAEAGAVRVPAPIALGEAEGRVFLICEFIAFDRLGVGSARRLGAQLADLHGCLGEGFGWYRDNFIGLTPQPNAWAAHWPTFFWEQRIRYQLELAGEQHAGAVYRLGYRLGERFDALFEGYRPAPSLLHGDLWAGNAARDERNRPVIFDPTVHYGDRECDIAMTELFGGFPTGFYEAYQAAWPLDPGYRVRRELYQLYHVLNHHNLFGGGYLGRAEAMIRRLLAEVGG